MMTSEEWEALATAGQLTNAAFAEEDEAFSSKGMIAFVETNEFGIKIGLAGVVNVDFGQTTHIGNTSVAFDWKVLESAVREGKVISFKDAPANGGNITIKTQ